MTTHKATVSNASVLQTQETIKHGGIYKLNKNCYDELLRRIQRDRLSEGVAYREHERGVEDRDRKSVV